MRKKFTFVVLFGAFISLVSCVQATDYVGSGSWTLPDSPASFTRISLCPSFYEECDNVGMMVISSARHLPLFKIDDETELSAFKTKYSEEAGLNTRFSDESSFTEAVSKYVSPFFAHHDLVVVYLEATSGGNRYAIDNITVKDGVYLVSAAKTATGITADVAGWLIAIEADESAISSCTFFDAILK